MTWASSGRPPGGQFLFGQAGIEERVHMLRLAGPLAVDRDHRALVGRGDQRRVALQRAAFGFLRVDDGLEALGDLLRAQRHLEPANRGANGTNAQPSNGGHAELSARSRVRNRPPSATTITSTGRS